MSKGAGSKHAYSKSMMRISPSALRRTFPRKRSWWPQTISEHWLRMSSSLRAISSSMAGIERVGKWGRSASNEKNGVGSFRFSKEETYHEVAHSFEPRSEEWCWTRQNGRACPKALYSFLKRNDSKREEEEHTFILWRSANFWAMCAEMSGLRQPTSLRDYSSNRICLYTV